jgi:hypothetical protein
MLKKPPTEQVSIGGFFVSILFFVSVVLFVDYWICKQLDSGYTESVLLIQVHQSI